MIPETNLIVLSTLSVSQVGGVELRQFHVKPNLGNVSIYGGLVELLP